MLSHLKDSVCLITGATRGIGRAITVALANQGAIVIGTATTQDGVDHISKYLDHIKAQGCGGVLDVTEPESINTLVKSITTRYGDVAILINNAGITRDNLVLRMQEQEWDDIMQTNLKSVYRLSKACLRGMIKARFGRIINIASIVGITGNPGQSNYAAAKAGLIGFSKSLAYEVGSRNITVNTIAPGFIETAMTAALSSEQRDAVLQKIPMGRLGEPDDIAQAVLYLASPMANYVTGTTLHINGGMFMN